MAQSRELQLLLTMKDNASANLKTLSSKLDGLGQTASSVGKKMSVFVTGPLVALGGFAIKSGAELESLQISFGNLTKQVGIDTDKLMKAMRETSKGTISDTNLILSANKAMSLGVGSSIEDINTLMEIARVKGRNMGLTMEQAFNDIVTGIGRGSPMILDNLGIVIKVGEANETYAKSIGKVVTELTAEEQKLALRNAVLRSGTKDLEVAGDMTLSNAERMQQFTATISNLKSEIGQQLIPILIPLLEKATSLLTKFGELDERTKKVIVIIGILIATIGPLLTLFPAIVMAIQALGVALTFLASNPIMIVMIGALTALVFFLNLIRENWWAVETTVKVVVDKLKASILNLKESWELIFGALKEIVFSVFVAKKEKIEAVTSFITRQVDRIRSAVSAVSGFVGSVGSSIGGVFSGGKATGGSVSSNKSYLVGEKGPELFSPGTNGSITPNNRLGGMSFNITITGNNINNDLDVSNIARQVSDSIMKRINFNQKLAY